jgi:Zn-dependent protease with chaperone function
VVPVTETFDGRRFRVASWVIDVPIRALPLEVMDFIWLQILITLIGVLVVVLPRARRQEREADRYALDRTADPDAFVAMIHSVSVIAGIRPNRTPIGSMGCTHAPPAQRMALAHEWAWNQQRNQVT